MSVRSGSASFDMAIYACLHVCMVGINCHRVALIRKYMYGYTYMEVFSCNLDPAFTFLYLYLLGWAEMNFLQVH